MMLSYCIFRKYQIIKVILKEKLLVLELVHARIKLSECQEKNYTI